MSKRLAYTYACGHEYQTIVATPEDAAKKKASAAKKDCPECEEKASVPAALRDVAHALRVLGNANASTPMGALEALGLVFKEGLGDIASAISEHADAVRALAAALDRDDTP